MSVRQTHPAARHWRLVIAGLLMVCLTACGLMQGQGSQESLEAGEVIRWQRSGGIAGFCDTVTISAAGHFTVWSCRTEPADRVGEGELTADELTSLDRWTAAYRSATIVQSDPATADSLTVTIDFVGSGDDNLPDDVVIELDRLAQSLLRRAIP